MSAGKFGGAKDKERRLCHVPPGDLPGNLTLMVLPGLRALYSKIDRLKYAQGHDDSKGFKWETRSDGSAVFTAETPLLYNRYRFKDVIGRGRFSQLIKAEDTFQKPHKFVAIKVMHRPHVNIGLMESMYLRRLNDADPNDTSCIVRHYSAFFAKGFHCLVFELMGNSLEAVISTHLHNRALAAHRRQQFQHPPVHTHHPSLGPPPSRGYHRAPEPPISSFIQKSPSPLPRQHQPRAPDSSSFVPMKHIRLIAMKMLTALAFCERQSIIHADLKPENILLQIPPEEDMEMEFKMCDFGNAMSTDDISAYFDTFELQSLFYRAPEVLLGLPFSTPVDMWSLGCTLCELFNGKPLFEVESKEELVAEMIAVLGPLPRNVFTNGKFFSVYFTTKGQLRDPGKSAPTSLVLYDTIKIPSRVAHQNTFELLSSRLNTNNHNFLSFLLGLLTYEPTRRFTPIQALSHPFIGSLFPSGLFSVINQIPLPSPPPTISFPKPSPVSWMPTDPQRLEIDKTFTGLSYRLNLIAATNPVDKPILLRWVAYEMAPASQFGTQSPMLPFAVSQFNPRPPPSATTGSQSQVLLSPLVPPKAFPVAPSTNLSRTREFQRELQKSDHTERALSAPPTLARTHPLPPSPSVNTASVERLAFITKVGNGDLQSMKPPDDAGLGEEREPRSGSVEDEEEAMQLKKEVKEEEKNEKEVKETKEKETKIASSWGWSKGSRVEKEVKALAQSHKWFNGGKGRLESESQGSKRRGRPPTVVTTPPPLPFSSSPSPRESMDSLSGGPSTKRPTRADREIAGQEAYLAKLLFSSNTSAADSRFRSHTRRLVQQKARQQADESPALNDAEEEDEEVGMDIEEEDILDYEDEKEDEKEEKEEKEEKKASSPLDDLKMKREAGKKRKAGDMEERHAEEPKVPSEPLRTFKSKPEKEKIADVKAESSDSMSSFAERRPSRTRQAVQSWWLPSASAASRPEEAPEEAEDDEEEIRPTKKRKQDE